MIFFFGVALILVGILNISSLIYEVSVFWLIFGLFQMGWGIQELRRYKDTKENPKYNIKGQKTKGFVWYSMRILLYVGIMYYFFELVLDIEALSLNSIYALLFFSLSLFDALIIISIINLYTCKREDFTMICLIF